jgi:Gpi18-like mannosyltransferase
MFRKKSFVFSLLFFCLTNIILYIFISLNYNLLPFQRTPYLYESHHYIQDDRVYGGAFNLIKALGNYDAQWYLRIANAGYPSKQEMITHRSPYEMEGLTYAFFPFYPLLVHIINLPFNQVEVTAFAFANLLLLINFTSLYYVVTKLYSEKVAIKTGFLLFLYPFSIFYRSYFTEGTFLFLLIWFCYFLIKKRWLLTSISLALLFVTRPNAIALYAFFIPYLIWNIYKKKVAISEAFGILIVTAVPLLTWIYFNYKHAGDALMWHDVEAVWYKASYPFQPIVDNIKTLFNWPRLAFHGYHESKLDTGVFVISAIFLVLSKKYLKPELWYTTLILIISPLLVKDFMSYSRYQMVVFPLFIYLAGKTNKYIYTALITTFTIGLFLVSLYFVNWYWIG